MHKKIIKPGMTEEQKVKSIHDYVVNNMRHTGGSDFLIGENALRAEGHATGYEVQIFEPKTKR
ncbi:MAG: hypothetical protein K0Q65_2173 [Clostridia bacterium]|nr:hypothetical protein [Clostridia bacterium]